MKTPSEIEQLIKEKENYIPEILRRQVLRKNIEDYRFYEYEKKYTEGYIQALKDLLEEK